jgi:hypothetical protein
MPVTNEVGRAGVRTDARLGASLPDADISQSGHNPALIVVILSGFPYRAVLGLAKHLVW